MAATIHLTFIGGPCDGKTEMVSPSDLAAGHVFCGAEAAVYVVQGVDPTHYRATYGPDADKRQGEFPNQLEAQFNEAWTNLMRTLAHRVPAQLERVSRATGRIKAAIR